MRGRGAEEGATHGEDLEWDHETQKGAGGVGMKSPSAENP